MFQVHPPWETTYTHQKRISKLICYGVVGSYQPVPSTGGICFAFIGIKTVVSQSILVSARVYSPSKQSLLLHSRHSYHWISTVRFSKSNIKMAIRRKIQNLYATRFIPIISWMIEKEKRHCTHFRLTKLFKQAIHCVLQLSPIPFHAIIYSLKYLFCFKLQKTFQAGAYSTSCSHTSAQCPQNI